MNKGSERKKILVVRFSSMGDVLLTTPVLRCLKNLSGPKPEVHFVTKKAYAGLLSANPHIDRLHLLDGSLFGLIRTLRRERPDVVIDLHRNIRSTILKWALGRPVSTFRKLSLRKYLLTAWKIDRLPRLHIVDRYLAAAAFLGVENDGKGLDCYLPESECVFPSAMPVVFRKGYVAVVIGGMHFTKRMSNEQIANICRELPLPVILLGGVEDAANGAEITQALPGTHVFNACGLLSMSASAYLVKMARLVISHDTGLMHVAAAFFKPLISVWGSTVPLFGMYPYMPGAESLWHVFEVENLPCRPCSRIGLSRCPKGHFDCIKKMDLPALIEKANQLLDSSR